MQFLVQQLKRNSIYAECLNLMLSERFAASDQQSFREFRKLNQSKYYQNIFWLLAKNSKPQWHCVPDSSFLNLHQKTIESRYLND